MMSDHTFSASSEEPLLGTPPTLSDDEWGEILDSVFEAPPGYADGLVDVFDEPESADGEADPDDHTIDFEGIAGSAGIEGDAEGDSENAFLDTDEAEPDGAETAAASDEDLEMDSAADSGIDAGSDPADGDDNGFAIDAEDFDATDFDADAVEGPNASDDLGASDDLHGDPYGPDDYLM